MTLWVAILAAPLIWFLNLETNFALAPLACSGNGKPLLYLASTISLVLVLLTSGLCWSRWRALGRAQENIAPNQPVTFLEPKRALALAAMALNFFCFLVILAQAIPNLMLRGCE